MKDLTGKDINLFPACVKGTLFLMTSSLPNIRKLQKAQKAFAFGAEHLIAN